MIESSCFDSMEPRQSNEREAQSRSDARSQNGASPTSGMQKPPPIVTNPAMFPQPSAVAEQPPVHPVLDTISRRYEKISCIGVFVFYIICHFAVEWNRRSSYALCPLEMDRARWTRDFNMLTTGGLLFSIWVQISRIKMSHFRVDHDIGTRACYYSSLTVNLIAAIAHCSIVYMDWGGVCSDAFG